MVELTPEAKQEVQRYMLKAITIPGIVLSVVFFFLGYFLDKAATGDAYHDAYQEVMSPVFSLMMNVSEAAANAKTAGQQAKTLLEETRSAAKEAELLRNQLLTNQDFQRTENIVQSLADNLASRQDFKEQIGGVLETRITQVEKQLKKVHSSVEDLKTRTRSITTLPDGCTTSISLGDRRKVVFQCDGNVVVYRVGDDGEALWDSGTHVRPGQP